jgi:hydroxyacylglutathione hydrolase
VVASSGQGALGDAGNSVPNVRHSLCACPSLTGWIDDGTEVVVGQFTGTVIHTPGHTPGSACVFFESQELLLSGDTCFGAESAERICGVEMLRLLVVLFVSIRERLYTLQKDTLVIPGHGPASSIGWEREYNVFVKE